MFGSKKSPEERIEREIAVLAESPMNAEQLAKKVGTTSKIVAQDLARMEKDGILLSEDSRGLLSIFRAFKRKT